MVCEEGRVEVEELGLMSSGPSVHTSSRVPKARRQSRTLGLRFSQYSNSCRVDKLHLMLCAEWRHVPFSAVPNLMQGMNCQTLIKGEVHTR